MEMRPVFSLHDGFLCKEKFNGRKHKVELSSLGGEVRQQEIVDTLNARLGELRIVKNVLTKIKTYCILDHVYLERRSRGEVTLYPIPISTLTPTPTTERVVVFDAFIGC